MVAELGRLSEWEPDELKQSSRGSPLLLYTGFVKTIVKLEGALIAKLEKFLPELGSDFAFVARQKGLRASLILFTAACAA